MTASDEPMSDADQRGAAAAPRRRPRATGGGYLFIPKRLQTPTVLTWLRRTHAWTGFWGALFFFCLGLSGIYLNHRAMMRLPQGALQEVAALDVIVEPGQFGSQEELAAWMQTEFDISAEPSPFRGRPGGPVSFNGQAAEQPAAWTASFRGANATITGAHQQGSNLVHVTRTNSGFVRMIIDLHKVVGVEAAFILLMDTMAGGMMVMSLTGVLLWSRLHGPRLAAVGVLGGVVVLTVVTLSPSWLFWTAP